MKKSVIKISIGLILGLIVTGAWILLKSFVIGDVAEIDHIELEITAIDDRGVDFRAYSMWSALAIKKSKYSYNDGILNISVIEVVVSSLYPLGQMDTTISEDFEHITEIRLADKTAYKTVWSKNNEISEKKKTP